jgi:hypothetical protein
MNQLTRTLEDRIKFNHGLRIGQSLVKFTHLEHERIALVEISPRGEVWYFTKPTESEMYASWTRVRGDLSLSGKGAVVVWPSRNAEFMAKFDGDPAAIIPVRV